MIYVHYVFIFYFLLFLFFIFYFLFPPPPPPPPPAHFNSPVWQYYYYYYLFFITVETLNYANINQGSINYLLQVNTKKYIIIIMHFIFETACLMLAVSVQSYRSPHCGAVLKERKKERKKYVIWRKRCGGIF